MSKIFEELVHQLQEQKLTIGSVESLTAGMFSSSIADIPGASKVLKGALVTYASDLKVSLVDVKKTDISHYGVVSKQVVKIMALNGQKKLQTDIVVSFSGNAGPTVLENKLPGEVYFGFAILDKFFVRHKYFSGNRQEVRTKSVIYAAKVVLSKIAKLKENHYKYREGEKND